MFIQTWNKYLPIIKILLKRSLTAEQTLDLDAIDFQRAAGGKKVKYSFSMLLIKGRPQNMETPPPLAKDLVALLQQDDVTRTFIRKQELEISMTGGFQLTIKNVTPPEPEPEAGTTDETKTSDEVKADKPPAVVK